MRIAIAILACLCAMLAGCATQYPKNPEDQAAFHVSSARKYFSDSQFDHAGGQIDSALTKKSGDKLVREFFADLPKAKSEYLAYLQRAISTMASMFWVKNVQESINAAESAKLFPVEQTQNLKVIFGKTLAKKNESGAIPFNLASDLDGLPVLATPEQQRILLERTVKQLEADNVTPRPFTALMAYVKKVGRTSPDGQFVESLLPKLNVKRTELEEVASIFPEFATKRKSEISLRAVLQVKNADRLFAEDMLAVLRTNIRGVEWVQTPDQKTTTVIIEKIRHDEKVLPERTEAITYSNGQVDIMMSVLFMPKNASYLYDVSTGGAELEYGYGVTAISNGATSYDQTVRGKVGGEYRQCKNARIQNVFGGVSSADFMANDDMRNRCNGNKVVSMDGLRKEVFDKITESVISVPQIRAVHSAN